jgi:hypothetical protein
MQVIRKQQSTRSMRGLSYYHSAERRKSRNQEEHQLLNEHRRRTPPRGARFFGGQRGPPKRQASSSTISGTTNIWHDVQSGITIPVWLCNRTQSSQCRITTLRSASRRQLPSPAPPRPDRPALAEYFAQIASACVMHTMTRRRHVTKGSAVA